MRRYVALGAKPTAVVAAAIACTVAVMPLNGQGIAERVAGVRDGQARISFTAREGVCGNGRNITTRRDTEDWEGWCEPGPVRVALDVVDGRIVDIDTYVGGRWRSRSDATDLGMVPAPDAARYLLDLASRLDGRVGKDAVFPATLADSIEVWPALLSIAKDGNRPRDTRKAAVFWVAQAAGEAATEGLEQIVYDDAGDSDVMESAVFALSQVRHDEGVPALIRIARTHRDPEIRKKAIFWLGQSEDPRAIALFEELLLKPGG